MPAPLLSVIGWPFHLLAFAVLVFLFLVFAPFFVAIEIITRPPGVTVGDAFFQSLDM